MGGDMPKALDCPECHLAPTVARVSPSLPYEVLCPRCYWLGSEENLYGSGHTEEVAVAAWNERVAAWMKERKQ
jgi:hypothetical protein